LVHLKNHMRQEAKPCQYDMFPVLISCIYSYI
jgi:hypothetical protein